MKKFKLSDLPSEEILSREELRNLFVSSFSGSGSDFGSGIGSGSGDCGDNAHYDPALFRCVCNDGYYFSYPLEECVEGIEPTDPHPKITACLGKQEFDSCSWVYQGIQYTGKCRYRWASELYCSDTIYT